MIDVPESVLDELEDNLMQAFPDISVRYEEEYDPPELPCITVVTGDSSTYQKTLDSSGKEHHAQVMVEINVFTSKGGKKQCRQIFDLADRLFIAKGFVRSYSEQIRMYNASVCRMVGRYKAVVSESGMIYRK